ncbi:MAG: hypothetical protein K6G69_06445 [Lachnospiraceae bacterium]|nr:hypothetical protein [Lachnospiraceae bacterium]
MSELLFMFMIIFQVAAGLILLSGSIDIRNIHVNNKVYYGTEKELNEQLKLDTLEIYQIKYSNMAAGIFLIIGYLCAFGADFNLTCKFLYAIGAIITSIIVVVVTRKIIDKILIKKCTLPPQVGSVWISHDDEDHSVGE